jgi:multidrug efflux pump subunit AcrA (membrane-fusion protein)
MIGMIPASVPLSFPNSGKLSEVDVTVGQAIAAGQVLAKLDTTAVEIAVDQAQSTLTQLQGMAARPPSASPSRASSR